MSSDIRIGFSMHPRWTGQIGLKEFIAPIHAVGLSVLEFELDDRMDCWNEALPLMDATVSLGLDLCFHAPYRASRSLVGFADGQRKCLEEEYRPLWQIAEDWGRRIGSPRTVVVHAAVAQPPAEPESLKADTLAYLGWILETFPHVRLALENNHPPIQDEIKIGIQRADVLSLAAHFPASRLGICWDMGHDYLRHGQDAPTQEWYSRVTHIHLHDVDRADLDHYPLVLGNVPYHGWIQGLKQAKMKGIAVLELKGERMKGWSMDQIDEALIKSIRCIADEVL